jgi:hypothetical protein
MKQLANNLIDALKAQPLALALVATNLAFLIGISIAVARKDALLAELVKNCVIQK